MDYIAYRRFKGKGINGDFNIKYGTIVRERDGFLYGPDGRAICAVTSENGWEYFHPDTPEGRERQAMIERLYRFYGCKKGAARAAEDFDADKWRDVSNHYWKNLLRTMETRDLKAYYKERLGEPPLKEV